MSGWLAVAEKLFGRPANELPSAYAVECACGRQVSGARSGAEQVTFCAACGTALFVLPRSVYPRPRGVQAEPAVRPPIPAKPQSRRTAHPVKTPRAAVPKPARVADRPPADSKPDEPVASHPEPVFDRNPKIEPPRLRRKLLGPVRLVVLGIAAVIGLTMWWSYRVSRRNEAERTLATSIRLAQQAFEENDLGEAANRFRDVRAALDTLGRTDSRAQELRQTAAEISASADLARSSLYDILNEAVATTERSGRALWADTFRSSYRDEWVLIDALVTRTSDSSGGRRFEIDLPLTAGGGRVQIVGDLACFERAVPGGSARRVIFAAQLDDFTTVPQNGAAWRIVLRPATAFLWSAPEHLERLGVEVDDETKRILAEQSSLPGMYQ